MARSPSYLDAPYLAGDPIPAPDVEERSSESAWALWNDAVSGRPPIGGARDARHDAPGADESPAYAATVPARLADLPAAATRPRVSLDALMVVARRNGRVCPRPTLWVSLCEDLQRTPVRGDPLPLPPLTREAWRASSALQKRLVLRDQIGWAARHGRLDTLAAFLVALAEDDWLHMS